MWPPWCQAIAAVSDGLKLRVVRSVATVHMTGMAGMVKAPARGAPRRLKDFDPASLLARSRRSPNDRSFR